MNKDFSLKSVCSSFSIHIWIAGDFDESRRICRKICLEGACISVEKVTFCYTYGEEEGVKATLINYPRFPCELSEAWDKARRFARQLAVELCQGSYSIQGPDRTEFYSRRTGD